METQTNSPADADAEFLDLLKRDLNACFAETTRPGSQQTHLDVVELSPSLPPRSTPKRLLATLQKLLRPASDAELIAALASLERVTGRTRGEVDDETLERYVAKLRAFPADIALHVCATWDDRPGDEGKFFPKPAQLKQACEELFATRRTWLPALQRFERGEVYRADAEQAKTDEDIAEVRALRDRVSQQLRNTARDAANGYVDSARNKATLILEQARRLAEEEAAEAEKALHP